MTLRALLPGVALAATLVLLALTAPVGVTLAYALGLLLGAVVIWTTASVPTTSTIRAGATRRGRAPLADVPHVLDAAPNPCILIDARAVVLHGNTAASGAFPALKQGQPLSFGIRDPRLLGAVNACLAKGGTQTVDFVEHVPRERSFACSVTRVANGNGTTALLVLRDTSNERAIEAMRADFVANASHELRTPLASVLGFIETIQGPARNDPVAREKFLGIMADQARRMARLVDDLLSLSRIEMKQHVAPSGAVELGALLRETLASLSQVAEERGVTLALAAPEAAVMVIGDRDELLSVFDNLIENAIKYGRSGKKVDVTLEAGGEAQVRVRDYGPGIAPDHLPRLTERFYRVDNALSRSEGGTGLGLALVKHTVRRHRGTLTIQSTPGEGATFAVTLPLRV